MPRPSNRSLASLGAAVLLGAGAGAGSFAVAHDGSDAGLGRDAHGHGAGRADDLGRRRDAVRQPDLPPGRTRASSRSPRRRTAATVPLRRRQGGGRPQAQGSGFVYDAQGHVITNQHVVDGASSVKVQFADGSSYRRDRRRHRSVHRHRGAQDRRARGEAAPARARRLLHGRRSATASSRSAARSASRTRSPPGSSARCTGRSRRRTSSRSTTRSRPTRRSTTATPAARCST